MTAPRDVLAAYGFADDVARPITVGLINQTFAIERAGRSIAILQRLHPIFGAEVNEDIEALTEIIAARGLRTPLLVRTLAGARHVEHGHVEHVEPAGIWRALTFVEGRTLTEVSSPAIAEAAGLLAGRFTRALEGVEHTFHFTRAGVHDTPMHLSALSQALIEHAGAPEAAEARPIAEAILEHARGLPALPATRRRIVHGDLKITNLLFEPERDVGLAVVDLDTMAHGTLPVELGDALRSWCNPAGESRQGGVVIELFEAALRGFSRAGVVMDADEREAIVLGLETITTELASRFARDALEDRYFGWDRQRFPTRRAHCRARAVSQLALARSIREARPALEAIAARA